MKKEKPSLEYSLARAFISASWLIEQGHFDDMNRITVAFSAFETSIEMGWPENKSEPDNFETSANKRTDAQRAIPQNKRDMHFRRLTTRLLSNGAFCVEP